MRGRLLQVEFKENGYGAGLITLAESGGSDSVLVAFSAVFVRSTSHLEAMRFNVSADSTIIPAAVLGVRAARQWANGVIWMVYPGAPDLLAHEDPLVDIRDSNELRRWMLVVALHCPKLVEYISGAHPNADLRTCAVDMLEASKLVSPIPQNHA